MSMTAYEKATPPRLDREDSKKMAEMWEDVRSPQKAKAYNIHDFVLESWQRSRQYSVDPNKLKNTALLDQCGMDPLIRANKKLIDASLPAMHDLYKITEKTGFCIALADKNGVLLKQVGSEKAKDFVAHGNFVEGSDWSEEVMGTNAVGTVVKIGRPIHIFGYEHYCKCACLCTCSAAPIFDENDALLGVLNLTGPYHLMNSHTLGAVQSTAKAIERKMKLVTLYKEAEKSSILRKAIIDAMPGYLMVFDSKGQLIQYNEAAGILLGIDETQTLHFHTHIQKKNPYLVKFLNQERPVYGETVNFKTPRGQNKKFIINVTPLKDLKAATDRTVDGHVISMVETHNVVRTIIKSKAHVTFDKLIGESSSFKYAVNQAKLAATSESNVLLLGESGVGKDLFAQSIHNGGPRRHQTFFAINCTAVPRELLSSELFGYDEGAFTGARKNGNPGKFELADRGTIFLDEIGESPLDFQASLLRVLEEKAVVRLGGRQRIPFDVRIISATNKNIFDEIKNNNFRHDLYYRIGVITIQIPPLRERTEDIPLLAEHLMASISHRFGKDVRSIAPDVMDTLIHHKWPGNVRELSNVIERAVSMAVEPVISMDLLPLELHSHSPGTAPLPLWEETPSRAKAEAQLIQNYLIKFGYNKTKTANALKISRSSLYRKINQYQLSLP